jgi:hypothetical protein
MRRSSIAFLAIGIAFIGFGASGAGGSRRAFLAVGLVFIILGVIGARRSRGGN